MAQRASLMTPRMEELLERVDSKFTLVTLSAMRAREINDYYNQLGEGLGKIVPPQVTSVSRKPLSIAMEEIEVGKIEWVPLPSEEELAAAAALAEAEAAAAREALADTPDETAVALSAVRGSRIVLGVSGGIAAYKAIEVCRRLVDGGAHVAPVLTQDALRFVGALTFSALASEPARTSLFDSPEPIPHTRLGQGADLVIVAPGHRQAARQVRGRDLRRPAHRHAAGDPRARCWWRRPCTPRCGSTRRSRTTWPRCAGEACTWSTPRPVAWPAATSVRDAWPIPPTSWPRPRPSSAPPARPATSPGCGCW